MQKVILVFVFLAVLCVGLYSDERIIRGGHPGIGLPFILIHTGLTIWAIVEVIYS